MYVYIYVCMCMEDGCIVCVCVCVCLRVEGCEGCDGTSWYELGFGSFVISKIDRERESRCVVVVVVVCVWGLCECARARV